MRGKQDAAPGAGSATKKTGRPTQEEGVLLARKVVETATELFMSLGYSGTTMDALARAAGISKKTIYSQYDNKEGLFRAVIRHMVRPSIREALSREDGLPLAEGVRHRAAVILEAALEPRSVAFYRLIQREVDQFPELGKIIERQNEEELYQPLVVYFADQEAKGRLSGIEPDWAARLFVFLVFGDLNHRLLMAAAPPSKAEEAEYLDRVCALFLRGVTQRSAD
jgi:AcrR family transcriptional regulator